MNSYDPVPKCGEATVGISSFNSFCDPEEENQIESRNSFTIQIEYREGARYKTNIWNTALKVLLRLS